MGNPLWFKDAIFYQLHVKTFQDSDGDGTGDFAGLLQRIDYFVDLGVTALWLLPFYPSPLRDDGYDIADYLTVNPSYGTLEQFDRLLEAAHSRGLRVVTELVLNHTSDQHAWFQRARRAPAGSPERDFYVWSDTADRYREARVIFQDFEPSNWTWDNVANAHFWHRFYSHQPDLNFDNPLVHDELLRVVDFWLAKGVDGVRLDAVPYLYEREGTNCENLPETHAFLRKLRAHVDEKFPDRMLLAEANQWPEDSAAYFGAGDECHMNFHFPLMPRLFMGLQMEDRFPIIDILEQTPAIPDNCQWAIFLRNHDELTLEMVTDEERDYMVRVYASDPRARINLGIRRRLAPLLGNNRRKIELINSLLLSLPGTPIVYYGDEIGMGDNIFLGDRNGVRTPMQWSPDRNAGFSEANPQRLILPLIIDPEYHYETINVENQQRNTSSLFWWMRRILAVRKELKAFASGTIEFLQPENAKVLSFLRRSGDETLLVVANLSRFVQVVELDLSALAGSTPEELFGRTMFPPLRADAPMLVTLGPHGFYWFVLHPEKSQHPAPDELPELPAFSGWQPPFVDALTRRVLPGFLPRCPWFKSDGRTIREFRIASVLELAPNAWCTLVETSFTEGQPVTYVVPLARVEGEQAGQILATAPQAVLARLTSDGILVDALHLPEVRERWLQLHRLSDPTLGLQADSFSTLPPETWTPPAGSSRIVETDRANTSIAFGDGLLLKVYRRFERGTHPEVELLAALQRADSKTVPPLHGALLRRDREGSGVLSSLTGYIAHQGDGWTFTLDALSRYFDRARPARLEPASADFVEIVGGVFPERLRLLGEDLAALHTALGRQSEPAFAAEPVGSLQQRSLYQAMRNQMGRALRLLRPKLHQLPDPVRALATNVLENRAAALEIFGRLLHHRFGFSKTRVHGDLHLGQLLNTGKTFVLIDFEGEARRSLGERSLKRCALVDVASLTRSLDYAAATALDREAETDRETLRPWAAAWVPYVSSILAKTYFEALPEAPYLPSSASDRAALLEIFLLDRAFRELSHELVGSGRYLQVPLSAIVRYLEKEPAA